MSSEINLQHIEKVIEACLLTAADPIGVKQLSLVFDKQIEDNLIEKIIFNLGQKYANSGLELLQLADGFRFRSRLEFQPYLNKLYQIKPTRYSRAIMETLAIIAYRQPVTRSEIEEIRGVAVNSSVTQTLLDRSWIEIIGQKQVPGRPDLFATTNKFLEELGISSIQELPALPNIDDNAILTKHDLIEEYDHNKELNNG